MKTLTHQTLIYDEDCPLCRAYSSAFVKTGMLDGHGKMPYSELEACDFVDRERAANEIALVDMRNKKTIYGIDSLLAVIGNSFPIVQRIGTFVPVHFLLKKMYRFISYNRKVIMPNPKSATLRTQCLPEFNIRYRVLYLIAAAAITALTLNSYADLLPKLHVGGWKMEAALAVGQLIFQALFLLRRGFRTILDYSGHLLTVSLMGSLMLLPMLMANRFVAVTEFLAVTYFGLVATIMFLEHFRRVELLRLPKFLCLTWVAYRAIFVLFIV